MQGALKNHTRGDGGFQNKDIETGYGFNRSK